MASTLLLLVLTYLLNHCRAIYECALIFTAIAMTVNTVTAVRGRFKSLTALGLSVIISFALLWKLSYYIDGPIVNGLVFASFSSLMVSLYFSTSAFLKFYDKFGFVLSNALALIIAALIDGLVMGLFFTINSNLTYSRILDIFSRESSYKMFYGFLTSAIMVAILKILRNHIKAKV